MAIDTIEPVTVARDPGLRVCPGDHVAVFYKGEKERDRLLRSYFGPGLADGQRCVCLVDAGSAAAVREALAAPDGASFETDQLRVVATTEVVELQSQTFDPFAMAGFWERQAEAAVIDGYPSSRLVGVMTWTNEDSTRLRHLAQFETEVQRRIAPYSTVGWCLYDMDRFGPDTFLDALRTHPQLLVHGTVIENPYYLGAEDFADGDGRGRPASGSDAGLRASIGALQGVQIIGMLMTVAAVEGKIARLCVGAARALVPCELVGLVLESAGCWSLHGSFEGDSLPSSLASVLTTAARRLDPSDDAHVVTLPGFDWSTAYPLRFFEQTLGWLIAASRTVPPDPTETRFLLQALGTQTGVALAATRATAAQRARAEEVEALNARLQVALSDRERLIDIHERFAVAAVEGAGARGITTVLSSVLGAPVVTEDELGNVLTIAGSETDFRAGHTSLGCIRARLRTETTLLREQDGFAVQPVRSRTRLLASLWTPATALGGSDLLAVALTRAATALQLELSHERDMADVEIRVRRDFTEELLAGASTPEEGESLQRRARRLGVNLSQPARVALAALHVDCDLDRLHALLRVLPRDLASVCNHQIVFVAADDTNWDELWSTLVDTAGDPNLAIGVGSVCLVPDDYPRSYRDAQRALSVVGPKGGSVRYDDLGLLTVLLGANDTQPLQDYLARWLDALDRPESTRDNHLMETLTVYLEEGGRLAAAADSVHVHVNTLKYRLRKIEEILSVDLSDPQIRFQLQVATTARRALALLEGSSIMGVAGTSEQRGIGRAASSI